MEIDIRGRNAQVTDALREHIDKRFDKVAKFVSPLSHLHLELNHERNPANPVPYVVKATLHLKGTVLTAKEASPDMAQSVELVAEKLARQAKRYNDKRRGQRH